MPKNNKKAILAVVWLVLLGGLMYGITHFNPSSDNSPSAPPAPSGEPAPPSAATIAKRWPEVIAHAAAPPRGIANAPYTIAEFGDFQCPQCGKVRPLIERMMSQYPRQVNLVFVHRPIPSIHQWALSAAEASEVAAANGKFWPMYDMLYSNQDDLEPGFYGDYASRIGINAHKFQSAFDAHIGQAAVTADTTLSNSLGIDETPTLLLRNNKTGVVTPYVGLNGNPASPGRPVELGIKNLIASPPWATTAQLSSAVAQAES